MNLNDLINQREGLISPDVFSAEMHERELDRVFGRCWLFVGHDSMVPNKHDYITNIMGNDPVIVQRDANDKIRVYLNRCRHRGAELCLYDTGNARAFTCSYHGWTFGDGKLVGMPYASEAYGEQFDRSELGLIEARVSIFGGLIFAAWDPICSLDEFLGDAKWYLENFLIHGDMGGLEAAPGVQRYIMPTNWKLLAENFAGDGYHFPGTHGSLLKLFAQVTENRVSALLVPKEGDQALEYECCVAANYKKGASHGFVGMMSGPASYNADLALAEGMGPEATEWFKERQRRLDERLKAYEIKPYSFHAGNIFPNLALIGVRTAFYAKGLIMHHPTAHNSTEVWMWALLEKGAPKAVRERQQFVLSQRQAAAGIVAPDDHENFDRMARTLYSSQSRKSKFHYAMAIEKEGDVNRPDLKAGTKLWPGLIVPRFSETIQMDFYRYWQELMQ